MNARWTSECWGVFLVFFFNVTGPYTVFLLKCITAAVRRNAETLVSCHLILKVAWNLDQQLQFLVSSLKARHEHTPKFKTVLLSM